MRDVQLSYKLGVCSHRTEMLWISCGFFAEMGAVDFSVEHGNLFK